MLKIIKIQIAELKRYRLRKKIQIAEGKNLKKIQIAEKDTDCENYKDTDYGNKAKKGQITEKGTDCGNCNSILIKKIDIFLFIKKVQIAENYKDTDCGKKSLKRCNF